MDDTGRDDAIPQGISEIWKDLSNRTEEELRGLELQKSFEILGIELETADEFMAAFVLEMNELAVLKKEELQAYMHK